MTFGCIGWLQSHKPIKVAIYCVVDMADSHQFGAYTNCFSIGPVCLCARQGTDLSEDSGPVPPANQKHTEPCTDTPPKNAPIFTRRRLQPILCRGCSSSIKLCYGSCIFFSFRVLPVITLAESFIPSSAMWRLDSPLRSHRPCWPQYQHAYSGLNKSLFAPAGPNSVQRGHQQSKTFAVAVGLHAKE
jgi:hypothetical protein